MSVIIGETSNAQDESFAYYSFTAPERHALGGLAEAVSHLRGVDTVYDDGMLELAARPPLNGEQLAALEVAGKTEVVSVAVEASRLALHLRRPQPRSELMGSSAPEPIAA